MTFLLVASPCPDGLIGLCTSLLIVAQFFGTIWCCASHNTVSTALCGKLGHTKRLGDIFTRSWTTLVCPPPSPPPSSSPSPSWTTLAYPPMSALLIKVFQRPFYQNSTHPPNQYWWVTVHYKWTPFPWVQRAIYIVFFSVYFLKVSFENQTLLAFLWWLSFLPGWFYSTQTSSRWNLIDLLLVVASLWLY